MDPYAKLVMLRQWASQPLSATSSTTMGTDTTDMDSAPWCIICMVYGHVSSKCPSIWTNLNFIRVRTENIKSLHITGGESLGAHLRGRGNGRDSGIDRSSSNSRGGRSGNNTPSTDRSGSGTRAGRPPNGGHGQTRQQAKNEMGKMHCRQPSSPILAKMHEWFQMNRS